MLDSSRLPSAPIFPIFSYIFRASYFFLYFDPKSYTEQKKKHNNRPPRIFDFKGKTLMISGLLLYDSHSWDIRVYHAKKLIFISIKIE